MLENIWEANKWETLRTIVEHLAHSVSDEATQDAYLIVIDEMDKLERMEDINIAEQLHAARLLLKIYREEKRRLRLEVVKEKETREMIEQKLTDSLEPLYHKITAYPMSKNP